MTIRRAQSGDAPAISQLVTAAYQHYTARIGRPPGPMLDDYQIVLRDHLVYALSDGTDFVGVLVLISTPQALQVDNVAVHPEHQGKGLGRHLMNFAEREALRLGYDALILYTNECMHENIVLYSRLGYAETERKTEHGYKRVYMRKSLMATTRASIMSNTEPT